MIAKSSKRSDTTRGRGHDDVLTSDSFLFVQHGSADDYFLSTSRAYNLLFFFLILFTRLISLLRWFDAVGWESGLHD